LANWERGIKRLKKIWASLLGKKTESEGEYRPRAYDSDWDGIIAALHDIQNDNKVSAAAQQSEWERSAKWDKWRFWLDFAAVIVAAGGVVYLFEQLNEMRAEQRPALWFGNDTGKPDFVRNRIKPTDDGQVVWAVHITNYGKGFITGGEVRKYLWLGNRGWIQSYGEPSFTIITPIAPTQENVLSAVSPPGISVAEYNGLLGTSGGIKILIEGSYRDLAGHAYPVSMCLARLNSGDISFCRTYNQMQ
jgi:hypothetical protein